MNYLRNLFNSDSFYDRDFRVRAINAIAALVVIGILAYFIAQFVGIIGGTDFSLLGETFNAQLDAGFLGINPSDEIWFALLKGTVNTLVLVVLSIALATFVGLLVGIARLAKHPLISRFAGGYVETFRNIPLLALMLLLSVAVFSRALPGIDAALNIPRVIYLSNRGLAVPRIAAGHELGWLWWFGILLAIVAAYFLRRYLVKQETLTGAVRRPNTYGFLLFLGIAAVTYLILFFAFGLTVPTTLSLPEVVGVQYAGGFALSIAFMSALFALVLYFSAFIAEIVRGSIQAVQHGQTEAANSLGLSAYQRFTLVILPQALTIMIPSLNNEYQNVNKDTAVAFAIGYIEILFILRQVANERGQLITLLIGVLFIYLFVNLIISFIMNTINRVTQISR